MKLRASVGMCGVCAGVRKCTYMYVGGCGYVRGGVVCLDVCRSAHNGVEPEISEKNDPNQNCPNY